jgi:outer membrane protein TolC
VADTELAQAYVAVRILNLRWQLAQQRVQSLAAQTPQRAEAERFALALHQQREHVVALLARWCGMDDATIGRVMAPALAMRELPLFDAPAPTRLPRAILRERADVGAAEQRLVLARKSAGATQAAPLGLQVLAGWIALEPEAPASLPEAAPDASELLQVAAHAEDEVRAQLRSLNERAAEAAKRLEIVRMRRIELDAALRRAQLGAGSQGEVAQDFERLLADNDELAIAGGQLAYSWISLQHSTSGLALQFER